ncbi:MULTISPECIES: hypothetical protein [unclassified Lysinibacillus]|uniref:hypothetical protein n=1 Tax=unclassified Lysinibacillus TaxID=2636778 RepID=UPI001092EE6C|nr:MULTISPECIES: hypothetical protein [unclassified Lysinibacillus]TGN31204.1 hypothetical protein E4L99_16865 [Lysinibacillus sp. S2017]
MEKINTIIDLLKNNSLISTDLKAENLNSGTTNGVLYLLLVDNKPTYVVKMDIANIIKPTQQFLTAYSDTSLLPNIIYTDPEEQFIVYDYIAGETHFNRSSKIDWMTILIKQLFDKYTKVDEATPWGRINGTSRSSWSDFNQSSLEYAQQNIGNVLSVEDHKRVELLVNKLKGYSQLEEKYYLHGDTGVHNFVYLNKQLKGVIDPSPLIGPKIYDFTYAFCSSPDNLDLNTLLTLFAMWNSDVSYTEERLLDEVIFQLYTRIGICIKVHPHDLPEYMDAWERYKKYLPNN